MKLPIYIEAAMGVFLVVILAIAGRNGIIPQNQKNNGMKQSEVEQKSDADMQNEKEAVAEEAPDVVGPGVRADVEVLGLPAEQQVAHAAAHQISDVAGVGQPIKDPQGVGVNV